MIDSDGPSRSRKANPDIIETVEKQKLYHVTNKDLSYTKLEIKHDINEAVTKLKQVITETQAKTQKQIHKIETELQALNLKVTHVGWMLGIGIPGLFALFGYMVKLILGLEK